MSDNMKEIALRYRLNGIILILIGLFMLLWPEASLKILCIAVGVILIVSGALSLAALYRERSLGVERGRLISGIAYLVIGILLIVISRFFVSVFLILAGIVLLGACGMLYYRAWQMRYEKGKNFIVSLIVASLILILGIVMIINPVGTAAFVIQLCGAALIIVGIVSIVSPGNQAQG